MSDLTSRTSAAANGGRATEPLQPDKSLGELLGDLTNEVGQLFRQEVELAKTELRHEAKTASTAAGTFAGAAIGGWMAVLLLSFAVAWLLDQATNTALAFAIVGVVWALVAAALAARGRQQMSAVKPLPETVSTLTEDMRWAKEQRN